MCGRSYESLTQFRNDGQRKGKGGDQENWILHDCYGLFAQSTYSAFIWKKEFKLSIKLQQKRQAHFLLLLLGAYIFYYVNLVCETSQSPIQTVNLFQQG